MKTIRLVIDLTYEDDMYNEQDPDELEWFKDLIGPDNADLFLFDGGELGDVIGTVKIVKDGPQ